MKRRKIILAAVAVILFWQINSFCQSNAPEMNPEIADMFSEIFSNAPPPPKGFATPLDYLKSFTNAADIVKAYRSGKISREEAELAGEMDKVGRSDKNPMDTYGKVVDQDGQPVVGAKVRGFLEFEEMDNNEEHDTTTDSQGQFHFLGLHGKCFAVVPEKEGYEFNREISFVANTKRPDNYIPNPKNPLIFRMWKLRGGEPMSHALTHSFVNWDDDFKHFDLYKGQEDPAWNHHSLGTNGELMVKATHGILFTNRGVKMFTWTVTLAITNGGLLAFNDPYPYIAPAEGYQTFVTLEGPTNFEENPTTLEGWGNGLRRGFYFKSKNGQVYGRIVIDMTAGRNYASFGANIYANVTGSRNLEYDPTKQIMTREQRQMWPLIFDF